MSVEGIEGYNKLTQLLKPYRDLRGFYFGVKATLARLCAPSDNSNTAYVNLCELETQTKGDGLFISYKPIRKGKIRQIFYSANTKSPLLEPLSKHRPDGEKYIGGYFDQRSFESILPVMEDIINRVEKSGHDEKPFEFHLRGTIESIIRRVENRDKDSIVCAYRYYVFDSNAVEFPSEEIKFYI